MEKGNSRFSLVTLIAGILASVLITAIVASTVTFSDRIAAEASDATGAPLADSAEIMKIADPVLITTSSVEKDVVLKATKDDSGITVSMTNEGQKPVAVVVDSWTVSFNGPIELADGVDINDVEKDFVLLPGDSMQLYRLDFVKHEGLFEFFPGEYTLEVAGWKYQSKLFENFTRDASFEDYLIQAKVDVGYDIDLIKSSSNKLLKAKDAAIEIEGEGSSLFQIDSSTKTLSFYIVNSGNSNVSAVPYRSSFTIWHSDFRFPSVGTSMAASSEVVDCIYLAPGEKKKVDNYLMSKSEWPISGERGISELMSESAAIPGTYILHFTYSTQPCTLDTGETVAGSSYSLIASMEATP